MPCQSDNAAGGVDGIMFVDQFKAEKTFEYEFYQQRRQNVYPVGKFLYFAEFLFECTHIHLVLMEYLQIELNGHCVQRGERAGQILRP